MSTSEDGSMSRLFLSFVSHSIFYICFRARNGAYFFFLSFNIHLRIGGYFQKYQARTCYLSKMTSDIHEVREAQKGTLVKSILYRTAPRLKEAFKWSPLTASCLGTPRVHLLKHIILIGFLCTPLCGRELFQICCEFESRKERGINSSCFTTKIKILPPFLKEVFIYHFGMFHLLFP